MAPILQPWEYCELLFHPLAQDGARNVSRSHNEVLFNSHAGEHTPSFRALRDPEAGHEMGWHSFDRLP
jgi:hypothetical protein